MAAHIYYGMHLADNHWQPKMLACTAAAKAAAVGDWDEQSAGLKPPWAILLGKRCAIDGDASSIAGGRCRDLLDAASLACRIHYTIDGSGVASTMIIGRIRTDD